MRRSTVAALAVISLVAQSAMAITFTGCIGPISLPAGVLGSASTTLGVCQTMCDTYDYVYFQGDSGACWCSNFGPKNDQQVTSDGSTGCPAGTFDFASFERTTSFVFEGCPDGMSFSPSLTAFWVPDPKTCFINCRYNTYATYWPNFGPGNGYTCVCDNNPSIGDVASCGPTTYFLFSHPPGAVASGLSRRSKQLVIGDDTYCPIGYDACQIASDPAMGYECLETFTELESCGGCRFGTHGDSNHSAPVGIDCTSIPGVSSTSVTCQGGHCVTKRCRRGFHLSRSGQCV